MTDSTTMEKQADLAGPGIGNYEDLKDVLPDDYTPQSSATCAGNVIFRFWNREWNKHKVRHSGRVQRI